MSAKPRFPALLVLLLIALAGVLALEVRQSQSTTVSLPAVSPSKAAVDEAPTLALGGAAASETQDILDRPLFFPSRRPVPPQKIAVAEAKAAPEPPLNFVLIGTILTGPVRTALVKPEREPSVEIKQGQVVNGWTISSIDADRIMVRHGANIQLLGLRDFATAQIGGRLPAEFRPTSPASRSQPTTPSPLRLPGN